MLEMKVSAWSSTMNSKVNPTSFPMALADVKVHPQEVRRVTCECHHRVLRTERKLLEDLASNPCSSAKDPSPTAFAALDAGFCS